MEEFQQVLTKYDQLLGLGYVAADVQNLAAMAHFRNGDKDKALKMIELALRTAPDSPAINNNAGNIYWLSGYWNKASGYLEKAFRDRPGDGGIASNLAQVYALLGEKEKAEQLLLNQLRSEPKNKMLFQKLAAICFQFGDKEGAKKYLYALIQRDPNSAKATYSWIRLNRCQLDDKGLLERINEKVRVKNQSSDDISTYYFCLAEMHHNSGRYDDAFRYFRLANSAARVEFSSREFSENLNEISAVISADWYGKFDPIPAVKPRMIFIVGMPRSGTSLVEQMLDCHPKVFGAGERDTIHELFEQVTSKGQLRGALESLDVSRRNELQQDYLQRLPGDSLQANFVVDKAPLNFKYVGFIKLLFPDALFIYCRRSPLDTIVSCFFQNFQRGIAFSFDLSHLARVYVDCVEIMQHWQKVFPESVMQLDYESLVSNPENSSRELLEFAGLEWNPDVLSPEKNPRPVQTASGWQVRQPISQGAVQRWKHYAQHLEQVRELLTQLGVPLE